MYLCKYTAHTQYINANISFGNVTFNAFNRFVNPKKEMKKKDFVLFIATTFPQLTFVWQVLQRV